MAEVNTVPKEKKSVNKSGYIYLLQVYPNDTENTYKLGRTKNFTNRYSAYTKNKPTIKLFIEAPDDKKAERELLKLFDEKFTKRPDTGREYYNGDVNEMKQLVLNYFINDENISDEKKDSIDTDSNDMTAEQSEDYYNNNTSTLCRILDRPINIGKDSPSMTIFDDVFPDWYSIPVMEKILKTASKFVKQIQKIISMSFEVADMSYCIDYNLFKHLLSKLPDYVEYYENEEIIDVVLINMSNYKRPVDHGCFMESSFALSNIKCIKGLKLKDELVYKLNIDNVYLGTTSHFISEHFEKKYGFKICRQGVIGSERKKFDVVDFNEIHGIANFISKSKYFNRVKIADSYNSRNYVLFYIDKIWNYLNPDKQRNHSEGEVILACFVLGCEMDIYIPTRNISDNICVDIKISLDLNNEDLRLKRFQHHTAGYGFTQDDII